MIVASNPFNAAKPPLGAQLENIILLEVLISDHKKGNQLFRLP
jgi:hypothetical protein